MARERTTSMLSLAEGAIGWLALAVTLAAALPRGANIPVAWLGLAVVVFALLALQLVLDLVDAKAPPRLGRLVLPGLLAVGAVAWGFAQTSVALAAPLGDAVAAAARLVGLAPPETLVHPAWATVDTPGAISADPIDGRQAAIRMSLYLALFWIAVRAGGDARRAGAMIKVVAVAVAALATYGLFAVASGENALLGEATGPVVSASFVNRNSFATYAAFGVLASLAVLITSEGGAGPAADRRRALRGFLERFFAGSWIYLTAFVVSATALMASSSRGGAMAAIAGLAAVVLISRRGGGGRTLGPVLAVALAAIVFVFAISAAGLVGRIAGGAAEEMRFPVYAAIVGGLEDRPYVGHGLGAFQDAFRAYLPRAAAAGGEWDLAHNTYLELAFELGLPAAGAFFLALVLVGARVLRGAFVRRSAVALVPLAGAGCTVAAAVHSAFDFSLQIPAIGALFAMILGLAWAQSFPRAPG